MGRDLKGNDLGTGLSQRKDGRYEARAVINGEKICLYDFNLYALKKAFKEAKGKFVKEDVVQRKDVTLSEWFEEWFEVCKKPYLRNTTAVKNYRRKFVNRYGAELGTCRLHEIMQIHVQRATNEMLGKGMNARCVADSLSVLRQCCEAALANRMIVANPCTGIIIKDDRISTERRVLEHWEQDLMLEVVENRYYSELYHTALLTGMRIGEIGGLRWEDIDFDKQLIRVRRSLSVSYDKGKVMELGPTKTKNSMREIPFFDDLGTHLKSWREKQEETRRHVGEMWRNNNMGDLVFTTSRGSPMTKYTFQHDINSVVETMEAIEAYNAEQEGRAPREIARIHPHAFRHTFATRCFENDMSPVFVQRIMGHSNYSTTASYTHVVDCVRDREVQKTKDFLSRGTGKAAAM